jgi:apolipoprotein N-acyltransferase
MNFLIKFKYVFVSLFAGMFYALGFPTYNGHSLFLAPLLGFTLLNWCLDHVQTLKHKLLISLFYSMGFYLLGFYWIPHLLIEFGGIPLPLNWLLGMLFSLVIIPQVYLYTLVKEKIKEPLYLAIIYVLLERFVPQQFPAHLGHSFLSLAPNFKLVLAPIFGAGIYTFFTAFTALSIVNFLKNKKMSRYNFAIIFLLIAIHGIQFFTPPETKLSKDLKIRFVQPNIGNFIKLDSEKGGAHSLRAVFDNYYYLSTDNIIEPRDLIIWPETAFPSMLFSQYLLKDQSTKIPSLLSSVIETSKAELFIGGYDSSPQTINGEEYQSDYNTAFHFGKNSQLKNVYHKMQLIPFGEGLPFGPLNSYLSKLITNISYFAEGNTYTGFKTENNIPFVSVICYEVLFSHFVSNMLNQQKDEASFMINLTNDSWYGDTAEPYQHLFLTKWRALEFNIPILRSTNTGITTFIDSDGSESRSLMVGEKTYMDLNLKIKDRSKTIYQRFGLLSLSCLFIFLAILQLFFKRKSFF